MSFLVTAGRDIYGKCYRVKGLGLGASPAAAPLCMSIPILSCSFSPGFGRLRDDGTLAARQCKLILRGFFRVWVVGFWVVRLRAQGFRGLLVEGVRCSLHLLLSEDF